MEMKFLLIWAITLGVSIFVAPIIFGLNTASYILIYETIFFGGILSLAMIVDLVKCYMETRQEKKYDSEKG